MTSMPMTLPMKASGPSPALSLLFLRAFGFGVTPFGGTNIQVATLKANNINYIATGAEGGISMSTAPIAMIGPAASVGW